jgi:hypothetical protein
MLILFKILILLPIVIIIVVPVALLFDGGKPSMNEVDGMIK